MKRLALCFAFCLCPTIAAAEEVVIGQADLNTCQDVTYLQAVDITIGENCLRTVQHTSVSRELFTADDTAAALLESWVMPYTFTAPTYAPLERKTLAILDTGFTAASPWLQSFITATYNVTTNETDVPDTSTHGTAVATAAILAMHNAPVDVLVIKIDKNGQLSIANIVKGINYAIEQGADVLNMSLGGTSADAAERHAVEAALAQHITVVAAAGNTGDRGNKLNYPAAYDGVISIGAINQEQQRAAFSAYNEHVSLVAPGAAVPLVYQQRVQAINGTSFASPFAAATIAAVQQYSDSSMQLLQEGFLKNADDIGVHGYDIETGYGIINGARTLTWLRGDAQATRTLQHDDITITFSEAVAPNTHIALYKDGTRVEATTSIKHNVVRITPTSIVEQAVYTLKIDRDVRSVAGEALASPLYVPIVFTNTP